MKIDRLGAWLREALWRAYVVPALALAALCGYAWFAWNAHLAGARLGAGTASLRQQLGILDGQADEIMRLRQVKPVLRARTELRMSVRMLAQEMGLATALVRIDVLDEKRVQVIFGTVAFADWLAWVAALEARQLWVESSRLEAAQAAGMVSATVVLVLGEP